MGRINKTNKTTPVSADEFIIYDSEDTTDDKNVTLGQIASFTETQDSTVTGTKIFADGVQFEKGNISFGQYSTLPTGVGSYVASYTSPVYGPRLLAYNGTAYKDLAIGSMPTAGTISMKSLANGDCNFGYNIDVAGDCTANAFYGDGSNLSGIGGFDYQNFPASTISGGLMPTYFDEQDMSTATYDSKSFSFASQDTQPKNIILSPDGTKLYMIGRTNSTIYQYTFGTVGDASTLTYSGKSFSVISQENGNVQDLYMSPDGLNMYIVGSTSDTVWQYTFGTAEDVSTLTYSGKSFSVATQTTSPNSLTFSTDGTKMYVGSAGNSTIFQYTLSIAGDVSTAAYASKSIVCPINVLTIRFHNNGTKLLVNLNSYMTEYILSTAWDISTATLKKCTSLHFIPTLGLCGGFALMNNTLFAFAYTGTILYQYSLYPEGYKNITADYYSVLATGNTNTNIVTSGVYVAVGAVTSNFYSSLTLDANYNPKIINSGLYEINYSASVTISSTNNIGICIFKNGAAVSNTVKDVVGSSGGGRYIISDKIFLYLSAGDYISLATTNYSTTGTVTFPYLSFNITRKI